MSARRQETTQSPRVTAPAGEGRSRVVVERVRPEVDCGRFPVKRVVGQAVEVRADIFADGHDRLGASLLYRREGGRWEETEMKHFDNDRWRGSFTVDHLSDYEYTVRAWVDPFASWLTEARKKLAAGQLGTVDLKVGAPFLREAAEAAPAGDRTLLAGQAEALEAGGEPETVLAAVASERVAALMRAHAPRRHLSEYAKVLRVSADPPRAGFSAWYELFPRSASAQAGKHGTLRDCAALVPEIAAMGFDVLYLPPIHPIGRVNRKGRNNSSAVRPGDPGSPWAIGSKEGGHKAVHPELGTLEDLRFLADRCREHGMELALDIAFQCAPDHPYVQQHPEWFRWRPDGTVQYAENPPKKYEDILPFHFESEHWRELWEELAGVVKFWAAQGVRIFRVDNPHTKPFAFWEWLIREVRRELPEAIFLAEAFTRPKVMYRLAKLGFQQSYTYFTWRNSKAELTAYVEELTQGEAREFFRPSYWPNTPDILPEGLQYRGRPAFLSRLALAATLSPNYGIYGPAFELGVNEPVAGREEYADSEKYETKHWERAQPQSLKHWITRLNRIRRQTPALQTPWNVRFLRVDNTQLLAYQRWSEDRASLVVVVVGLDPFQIQAGELQLPLEEWGFSPGMPLRVEELLSGRQHLWQGERVEVSVDPQELPAHIYGIHGRVHREQDFDYYM